MIESLLTALPELGATAIIAVTFIVVMRELISSHRQEREQVTSAFEKYVETNNHQKTEQVNQQIQTLKETTKAMSDLSAQIRITCGK